jgi:hypothetical protein
VFRELAWTGFASADFMRRRDGSYVLLEINPRPWGSIAAAAAAGVDLFTPFAILISGGSPTVDLTFRSREDCRIFPRYLLSPASYSLRGAGHALRDLLGPQGREWRDPRFLLYALRRMAGPAPWRST